MRNYVVILLATAALLTLVGCGNRMWEDSKKGATDAYNWTFDDAPTAKSYHDTAEIPVIELNHRAADVLYSNIESGELAERSQIYVRRFINQINPGDQSIFGQVVTQQVADRLVQKEVHITDGKPGENDFTYPEGITAADYAGEGEVSEWKLPPRAAMLTGDYVIGDNFIYLSAKVTRLVDMVVVSAHNWTIPITDNIRQMLPQLKVEDGLEPSVKTAF